jgi:hypothetical protein
MCMDTEPTTIARGGVPPTHPFTHTHKTVTQPSNLLHSIINPRIAQGAYHGKGEDIEDEEVGDPGEGETDDEETECEEV